MYGFQRHPWMVYSKQVDGGGWWCILCCLCYSGLWCRPHACSGKSVLLCRLSVQPSEYERSPSVLWWFNNCMQASIGKASHLTLHSSNFHLDRPGGLLCSASSSLTWTGIHSACTEFQLGLIKFVLCMPLIIINKYLRYINSTLHYGLSTVPPHSNISTHAWSSPLKIPSCLQRAITDTCLWYVTFCFLIAWWNCEGMMDSYGTR